MTTMMVTMLKNNHDDARAEITIMIKIPSMVIIMLVIGDDDDGDDDGASDEEGPSNVTSLHDANSWGYTRFAFI